MKELFSWLAFIALAIVVTYIMYWLAKTLSYHLFYEDMVIQTIMETVRPEFLK